MVFNCLVIVNWPCLMNQPKLNANVELVKKCKEDKWVVIENYKSFAIFLCFGNLDYLCDEPHHPPVINSDGLRETEW